MQDFNIPKREDYYKIREYYRSKELQKASILFKWKSEDIKIPRNIEAILADGGSIGYCKENDTWYMGQFTGMKDKLNEFTEYVGITLDTNHVTKTMANNKEVVVCGNNPFYLPDSPIFDWYAGFSEDIDISMYFQLINSRNIPALTADSDQKANQIKKAFEQIKAGVPVVITTDIFSGTETIDLTDKSLIEKMQYITSFNADVEKRFANARGIDVNTLDKRAQVTSDELNQFTDVTTNNFLVMLEARQEFCEKMKDIFGINIECVRNPIYSDEPSSEETDSEEAQEAAEETQEVENNKAQEETPEDNKDKEEDKDNENMEA